MSHRIPTELGQPSRKAQVLAALADLDLAKGHSQRMAALRTLQPLFAGNVARDCS